MEVFRKLVMLKCSMLAWSNDYDFKYNYNFIFVNVPSMSLGYEGITWQSSVNDQWQLLQSPNQDQCLAVKQPYPHRQMAMFQNFGLDSIVFYYDQSQYTERELLAAMRDLVLFMDLEDIHIRLFFGKTVEKATLNELLDSYWPQRKKQTAFSGAIRRINELNVLEVLKKHLKWRERKDVLAQYLPTSFSTEYKNELLEKAGLQGGNDYLIMLYGEDCPKCEEMKSYWGQVAPVLANASHVKIGHTDMTSSIFWGIWPYDLPHRRFYTGSNLKMFKYMYEDYTISATVQYLKRESPYFLKFLKKAKNVAIQKKTYSETHCYNWMNDTKMVGDHLRFTNVDYDDLVDREVALHGEEMEGYVLYDLRDYEDKNFAYPFFRVVQLGIKFGTNMKVALMGAPLYKDQYSQFWWLMSQGWMPVGIQSFRSYPYKDDWEMKHDSRIMQMNDPYWQDILKNYCGWLHTVRNPDYIVGQKVPRILFSESDLQWLQIEAHFKGDRNNKVYDIGFVNVGETEWHQHTKNWTLAAKIFDKLVEEIPEIKILIMGRKPPEHLQDRIDWHPEIKYHEYLDSMSKIKILLVTSVSDASPRVVTQAFSMNATVALNRHIFGGWKYINEENGAFFSDENEAVKEIKDLLRKRELGITKPLEWFRETYKDAPKRLQAFIEQIRKENFMDEHQDDDVKALIQYTKG